MKYRKEMRTAGKGRIRFKNKPYCKSIIIALKYTKKQPSIDG